MNQLSLQSQFASITPTTSQLHCLSFTCLGSIVQELHAAANRNCGVQEFDSVSREPFRPAPAPAAAPAPHTGFNYAASPSPLPTPHVLHEPPVVPVPTVLHEPQLAPWQVVHAVPVATPSASQQQIDLLSNQVFRSKCN